MKSKPEDRKVHEEDQLYEELDRLVELWMARKECSLCIANTLATVAAEVALTHSENDREAFKILLDALAAALEEQDASQEPEELPARGVSGNLTH